MKNVVLEGTVERKAEAMAKLRVRIRGLLDLHIQLVEWMVPDALYDVERAIDVASRALSSARIEWSQARIKAAEWDERTEAGR